MPTNQRPKPLATGTTGWPKASELTNPPNPRTLPEGSRANFRRWKHRLSCGQPTFSKPGPKKVAPLDLDELRGDVCRLDHGRQRSRGVGPLCRHYQSQISRRDLAVLAATMRRELLQQQQAELRHLTWHVPGSVWSLDDAELVRFDDHPLHRHQVQDMASRYKFTPLVGQRVLGETVALQLEQLFERHGPPLVLKRDNGSNLNHPMVDEVLRCYLVVPLNSPPHYPPYNGGMERAVRELKTPLIWFLAQVCSFDVAFLLVIFDSAGSGFAHRLDGVLRIRTHLD